MNETSKTELFLVLLFSTVYATLVLLKMVSPDGFIVLATYITKKFLDERAKNRS